MNEYVRPPIELKPETIKMVDEVFDKITEFMKAHPEDGARLETTDKEAWKRWHQGEMEPNEVSFNLRFDWEVDKEEIDRDGGDAVLEIMFRVWKDDFLDLLENGDFSHPNDALLKAMDGSKKRGHEPVAVHLGGAQLHHEYKERKNTVEYTLYFRPFIVWPA